MQIYINNWQINHNQQGQAFEVGDDFFVKYPDPIETYNVVIGEGEDGQPTIELKSNIAKTVPQELSPRQVRLAMLGAGLDLSQIDTMIDGLDEPQRSQVKIMWEYSTVFLRSDPILNGFAEQLGLSQDDLDNLFIAGASIW